MSLAENTLQPLRILPLRFLLRSQGLNFPEFSGSVWHGGLGMILAKQSPHAFSRLYQAESESRLYAFHPPMNNRIEEGELFEFQLTLFGDGVDCALAVMQAIAELGKVGLRPGGYYEMQTTSYLTPDSEQLLFSHEQGFIALPQAIKVAHWLNIDGRVINRCEVSFVTPLRIKEGNELLRTAPSYGQLIRRILGRVDQLAHATESATPLPKIERTALYAEAEAVQMESARIAPIAIQRRSARSGQSMQSEGFVGSVVYRGEMCISSHWLRLASLIQVGGKTAFGFGGLQFGALK